MRAASTSRRQSRRPGHEHERASRLPTGPGTPSPRAIGGRGPGIGRLAPCGSATNSECRPVRFRRSGGDRARRRDLSTASHPERKAHPDEVIGKSADPNFEPRGIDATTPVHSPSSPCQPARNSDPRSACEFDPSGRAGRTYPRFVHGPRPSLTSGAVGKGWISPFVRARARSKGSDSGASALVG